MRVFDPTMTPTYDFNMSYNPSNLAGRPGISPG